MDGQRTPLLQKGSAQGPRIYMNNSKVDPPIPERESIGCHNFDHIGTDFGKTNSWVVKIRFRVSHSLRVSFHVGRFAHHILMEI